MAFSEIGGRIKAWQERESAKRRASKQRVAHLQPLREAIIRRILAVCWIALPVHTALVIWGGMPITWKNLAGTLIWPAISLFVVLWSLKWSKNPKRFELATGFLFQAIVFAAAVPQAISAGQGGYPHYGGLIILTIILSGLLIGEFYVGAWTIICCVSFQFAVSSDLGWRTNLGWSALYVATAWLVSQFSRHLERLHEMSRTAEETQRSSIVAERTRFARDIHGALLEGFTRVLEQLSEAERTLSGNSAEARTHLENARKLAGESLVEARRTIASLHIVETKPQGSEN
jgi:signal transduction histidine kinase